MVTGAAAGQGHADFSGTWVIDTDKTAVAAGRSAGTGRAGAPSTIAQDATSLIITRQNGAKTVFRLDGKEVTNKTADLGPNSGVNPRMNLPNPGTDVIYKSQWQGSKLVTTMSGRGANGPTMATEIRWLEGAWMVTETTRKTPTGDVTRTTYWKKSANF
jgi:hypothetical protein